MNVPNLRDINMALLTSWSRRFYDEKDSDWKKLLCFKNATDKPNILRAKPGLGFPFWKSVSWAFAAGILVMHMMWPSGMIFGLGIVLLKPSFGISLRSASNKMLQLHKFGIGRCYILLLGGVGMNLQCLVGSS